MTFAAPPPLQPGDRVAIVAPSGPFDRQAFLRGHALLAARYQPVFTERIFEKHRYLAGEDAARAEELQRTLDDTSIRAIFAARGGYGGLRLLPSLRLGQPRWLVGFSDFTVFHALAQRSGWRSLHAPVLTQLGTQAPEVAQRCFDALEGRPLVPLRGTRTITGGVVEGPLLGGNLMMLSRLIGTPWLPSLRGSVLLLEDVGERPYAIDRMWTHLRLSGALDGVRGLVFGEFTGCEEKGADYSSAQVVDELARELGVPAAAGFPIGHGAVNQPVVLGAQVRLDAGDAKLEFQS